MRKTTKIVIASVVAGTIMMNINRTKPINYDDFRKMIDIYNHEIQEMGGQMELNNATKQRILDEINLKISNRIEINEVEIDGQRLTADEYNKLKADLIRKTSQKTKVEILIDKII